MFVLQNSTVLDEMETNQGTTVSELSKHSKVMLIFLRHLGCIFCKETLSDLRKAKETISSVGTKIVLVHMAEFDVAGSLFKRYEMDDIHHISDIDNKFYESFGLAKGDFRQLFGFRSWLGMGRAVAKGNMPSTKNFGDPSQMPGIFLIKDNQVLKSYKYNSVGDLPNYLEIAN